MRQSKNKKSKSASNVTINNTILQYIAHNYGRVTLFTLTTVIQLNPLIEIQCDRNCD